MKPVTLLTIDLSMFGEGAAPAGEGSAPAPAEAPAAAPQTLYGKQPEQTAVQQQIQTQTTETAPDKGKLFKELINGEYKDQYTEATQKLINRRFRETDEQIKATQPIIDILNKRYGTDGDPAKIAQMLEADNAFWESAAEQAGKPVEQYMADMKKDIIIDRLTQEKRSQQEQYLAAKRYQQWDAEAKQLQTKYPQFNLAEMMGNDLFTLMLRNNYPMEQAFRACSVDYFSAQAAATAEKAVTDNIKARGSRPTEAGANNTPAFTVKDDVSKLSDKDVLAVLAQISNGGRVTFS